MTQFEILKLVTDLGLVGSLLYFAFRFIKNQTPVNTHQLQELHSSLRNAIREADHAGKGLHEQFIQRKHSLEKLLVELQSVESRVTKALAEAEQQRSSIETASERDLLEVDESSRIPVSMEEFSEAVVPTGRTNIFGEPITEIENNYTQPVIHSRNIEKAFSNTPLTGKIEKQVEVVPVQSKAKQSKSLSLEEVYVKAEDMLRAGQAIEVVSKETHLTSDEVRLLSQMVEGDMKQEEQASQNASIQDNRLGVLAGFKRQTQVL